MRIKNALICALSLPLAFSLMSRTGKLPSGMSYQEGKGPLLNTTNENLHSTEGREKANVADPTLKSYRTISSYMASSQSYHIEFETKTDSMDLIFGYYGSGDRYLPFTVQYEAVLEDGTSERRETLSRKVSENNLYDGIGYNIGSRDFKADIDLPLREGESVKRESLKFFNIFQAKNDSEKGYVPDLSKSYYYDGGEDRTIEASDLDRSQDLLGTIEEIASFGDYAAFTVTIENKREDRYEELKASAYKKYKKQIESGEVYFEDSIPSLKNAAFQITYKNGTTIERGAREGALASTMALKSGKSKYCILFKGVSTDDIAYFSLARIGFSRKLNYTSSQKVVTGTEFKARVGRLTFYSGNPLKHERSSINEKNFTRIRILCLVGYFVLFALLAAGLYFYKKKKYRNDEFRRVNTKRYILQSSIIAVALGVFLFDIFFIVLRRNPFKNTRVVYNPLDNYIVVLSVLSVFAIGYFIKSGLASFKNWKQRKEKEKLKLDDRESDDGTK